MHQSIKLILAAVFSVGIAAAGEELRFGEFDRDRDGRLSRVEVAHTDALAKRFGALDGNGDGYLSRAEARNVSSREKKEAVAARSTDR